MLHSGSTAARLRGGNRNETKPHPLTLTLSKQPLNLSAINSQSAEKKKTHKAVRRGAGRGGGEEEKDVTQKSSRDPLLQNDSPEAIFSKSDACGNRAGLPGQEINVTTASLFYLPTPLKRFFSPLRALLLRRPGGERIDICIRTVLRNTCIALTIDVLRK